MVNLSRDSIWVDNDDRWIIVVLFSNERTIKNLVYCSIFIHSVCCFWVDDFPVITTIISEIDDLIDVSFSNYDDLIVVAIF